MEERIMADKIEVTPDHCSNYCCIMCGHVQEEPHQVKQCKCGNIIGCEHCSPTQTVCDECTLAQDIVIEQRPKSDPEYDKLLEQNRKLRVIVSKITGASTKQEVDRLLSGLAKIPADSHDESYKETIEILSMWRELVGDPQ